ncbi:MAG: hypothetical protein ACOYBQ_10600 [Fluviibacter sp.]
MTKRRQRFCLPPIKKEALNLYAGLSTAREVIDERERVEVLQYCPRGSVLEQAVLLTQEGTDCPPSLTFFGMMASLGAALSQEGFHLKFEDGQIVYPNPWVLALAPSGTGKTYTQSQVVKPLIASHPITVPESITPAGYFQFFLADENAEVSNRKARAFFFRDEAGEWFRYLNTLAGQELRDYFLRSYDGGTLEKRTKTDGQMETLPINLTVLGTAVDSSFFRQVTADDFTNGLMQRFQFVLSHDVPNQIRPRYGWAAGRREAAADRFVAEWQDILNLPRVITCNQQALNSYDRWFLDRFPRDDPDQKSYFRRIGWASFKYSIVYAVLAGSNVVDQNAMDMALKLADRHIADLGKCMRDYTCANDWHRLQNKVREHLQRNPTCTRSILLQRVVQGISSKELNVILETLSEHAEVGQSAARLLNSRSGRPANVS